MQSKLKNPNFYYLLAGLLSLLLINPIISDMLGYSSNWLTSATFSSCMIIGIWSLHGSKTLFRLALVLIAISTTLSILNPIYPELPLQMLNIVLPNTFTFKHQSAYRVMMPSGTNCPPAVTPTRWSISRLIYIPYEWLWDKSFFSETFCFMKPQLWQCRRRMFPQMHSLIPHK